MINLRYFCFVVIQLYLKVRALALFYFINLHHYTYITWIWTSVHRDGHSNLNPDVSPTETSAIIHRTGPKSGISDVCEKNHIFHIHRDSTKTPDSDVSKKRIHRNSTKVGNPDVSPPSRSIRLSNPRCHIHQTPSESPRKS